MPNKDTSGPEGKGAKTGCCGGNCGSHTTEEIVKIKKNPEKPKNQDSKSDGCCGGCCS